MQFLAVKIGILLEFYCIFFSYNATEICALILLFFQAQRKWVEEQEEFARRRKEHEIKMIEMEQVS